VGLSEDVRSGMAVPVCLAGVEIAVWKSASGEIHAWGDRCPHRGMRLSHGFVRGEQLACIYHGWQYGLDGGCTSIPAHPNLTPPKSICAKTYFCAEKNGVIWVSLQATEDEVPELDAMTPIRSLPIDVAAAQVHENMHSGSIDRAGLIYIAEVGAGFLVQPAQKDRCMLHILSDGTRPAKTVSRWAEEFRRDLERVPA